MSLQKERNQGSENNILLKLIFHKLFATYMKGLKFFYKLNRKLTVLLKG